MVKCSFKFSKGCRRDFFLLIQGFLSGFLFQLICDLNATIESFGLRRCMLAGSMELPLITALI